MLNQLSARMHAPAAAAHTCGSVGVYARTMSTTAASATYAHFAFAKPSNKRNKRTARHLSEALN